MKVLLLSMARSRSSVIVNSYSQKYQIPNLFEDYEPVSPNNVSKMVFMKKPEILWDKFQTLTKNKTDTIFSNNQSTGFVIKLFPINIVNDFQFNPLFNKIPNWNITQDSILDLEESFRISEYDKILISYRHNMTDQICSWWHAYNKSFFLTNNKNVAKAFTPKGKIVVSTFDSHYTIKSAIIHKKLLEYIPTYLNKKNLPYTLLEYNEVPTYLQENFSDIEFSTIDTKYDYKNLIENYNEINETVQKLELEVEKEFVNFF